MTSYKVEKVLSSKGNRAMVTVRYEGRTVTRHLVDGIGWHPDDGRPRIQSKMLNHIATLKANIAKFEGMMKLAQKEVDGKGPHSVQANLLLPVVVMALGEARVQLASATLAYEAEVKENPLKVQYEYPSD